MTGKSKSLVKSLVKRLIPKKLKRSLFHRFMGILDHLLKSRPFIDSLKHISSRNKPQLREIFDIWAPECLGSMFDGLKVSQSGVEASQADSALLKEYLENYMEQREMDQLVVAGLARRGLAAVPEVSIVIPVFNKGDFTYRCIRSVLLSKDSTPYEIIVVDNGSTDDTPELVESFGKAVRVIRNEENLGFVGACNQGAGAARGTGVLFLNNDTEVSKGWLDRLAGTLREYDKAGAAGAKLVYPNGTIQEAGGIVFDDGNAANYGHGQRPDDFRYNFVREVDYCSGACLLVRKDLFDRLGGFDTRYAPAYYEDTDLCFGIRSLGYKVVYQPLCEVTHYEGVTAGKDITKGYKRYQAVNKEKFIEKWKDALMRQHHLDRARFALSADRRTGPRILVIDERLPTYDKDSGSLRMFWIMKLLQRQGCRVSFMYRPDMTFDEYAKALANIGVRIVREGDVWEELGAGSIDLVFVARVTMADMYLETIRKTAPGVPVVFDTVDIHHVREKRMAELNGDRDMMENALRTREKELYAARTADMTIAVTETDKKYLLLLDPSLNVDVIPNIHETLDIRPSVDGRDAIMFIGGFMHKPNVDAVSYFHREILPVIRKDIPDAEFLIVGSNPPDEVLALASDKVVVTGYVPETAPYFARARVFVSPLRYGAGMKGKIGEALSHGVPVVTTSIGAEGMGLTHGEDCLIQDDPAEFAREAVRLFRDDALWMRLAVKGRGHIAENFGPEAVAPSVDKVRRLAFRHGITGAVDPSSAPLLSVIVCACDHTDLLKRALESLVGQTLDKGLFEVVVVNDGPSDKPEQTVKMFEGLLPARYFHQKKSGLASSRNHGIYAARGEVLFFLGEDDIASPTLLEEHVMSHRKYPQDNYAVLNYTTWAPDIKATPLMRYAAEAGSAPSAYKDITDEVLDYTSVWGDIISCKKAFLIEHGVFNPAFRLGCGDMELGYRLSKHDLKVVYNSHAVSYMARPVGFEDFCRTAVKLGKSQYLFSTLHDDPAVSQYTDVAGAAKEWGRIKTVYDAKIKYAAELDRMANERLKKGLDLDDTTRKEVYDSYRWAQGACRVKGIMEARKGSGERPGQETFDAAEA